MKALILAAGEGQRLRPLTQDRPKPMLPVGDSPLLEQIILLLKQHEITELAINLHYKPWAIVRYLGRGQRLGVRIHYSYERQMLGSAGAAKRLAWFFQDGPFIVFYGDLYTDMNISKLVAAHKGGNAPVTMALYEVNNPTACGIVGLDKQNYVTRFVEKPAPDQVFSRLANAGVFVVDPQILDMVLPEVTYDFGHDLFPLMLDKGLPIQGHRIREMLIDIGTPKNYQRAQHIAARHVTDIPTYTSSLVFDEERLDKHPLNSHPVNS
jgi:NDP-sugar pyrophosphorylase family protein